MAQKANEKNEVSVKMNADVYRIVRAVAGWRGVNVADYLTEIIEPAARRDAEKMHKEMHKRAGGQEAGE